MARKSARRALTFECDDTHEQSCYLCLGHHVQMSTPSQWKSEQASAYASSIQVPLDANICKLCMDDISKVVSNASHIPRWRKRDVNCCIMGCGAESFVSTKIPSTDILKCFEAKGLEVSSPFLTPTPLCRMH